MTSCQITRGRLSELYTGISVYHAPDASFMSHLYAHKEIDMGYDNFSENEYLIVQHGSQSALCRYLKGRSYLLDLNELSRATAIRPRNKEQHFAMDALLDDAIKVVVLTGKAGTGKTLATLAAAVAKVEQHKYKRIILTRPSSQVGKRELGILPGNINEKLMPFMINYLTNFQVLFPNTLELSSNMDRLVARYNIDIVPLQLIRGASFKDCLVIADEVQVLDYHEMLTLGTRISENSKLILMGDLNQRDESIAKEKTGLFRFINDRKVKDSHFTASVHMVKSERGEVSALFSDVFDPE